MLGFKGQFPEGICDELVRYPLQAAQLKADIAAAGGWMLAPDD